MGQRIKELRIENGLTLKQLAALLNVTIRTIQRYEDNSREPSVDCIKQLCRIFDVSADYLLGLVD